MKCQKCKNDVKNTFTWDEKRKTYQVCDKCLEKLIYKERKKGLKKWIRL